MREELTILAETATTEDERVDFKRAFSPEKKAAFWTETVKDIVAFANTNGGVMIFGICDDGSVSDEDCTSLLNFDPAKITDQIAKYTGYQFSNFFIDEAVRAEGKHPALFILPTRLPIVFTRVGTYEIEHGQQKNAFSVGTLYFRHGAKSEPATQDDVRDSFYRELCRVREEWLGNIRTISEAEPGSQVLVTPSADNTMTNVRVTKDPSAPAVRVRDLSDTHPYRQNEAVKKILERQPQSLKLNSHDIQAVKLAENLAPSSHPNLIHKPHKFASPQYSEAFVELICDRITANENYLTECRLHYKQQKYG